MSREDRASKEIYNFLRTTIFGRDIPFHFFILYIFAIIYSPEDMKRRFLKTMADLDISLVCFRASKISMRAYPEIGDKLRSGMRGSRREGML
jgi:hypothetical protein